MCNFYGRSQSSSGGKGISMMRDAGIEVEIGLCETEARALNRVF